MKPKNTFKETYLRLETDKPYEFNMKEVGNRYLKNLCLSYLMLLPDADTHENMGMRQFNNALSSNMTDTMAALRALTNVESSLRAKVLSEFYSQWHANALVVDKWLAAQSAILIPAARLLHAVRRRAAGPALLVAATTPAHHVDRVRATRFELAMVDAQV